MRRTSAVLVAFSLLALTAPTASAGVGDLTPPTLPIRPTSPSLPKVKDAQGDVDLTPAGSEVGGPSEYPIDIKWMKVSYTEKRLKALVRFYEPVGEWSQFYLVLYGPDENTWFSVATPDQAPYLGNPEGTAVEPCTVKFRANPAKRLMRMSLPSSCIGAPATIGVNPFIRADVVDGEGVADGSYHSDSIEPIDVIRRGSR
jgi:hypothetical protein